MLVFMTQKIYRLIMNRRLVLLLLLSLIVKVNLKKKIGLKYNIENEINVGLHQMSDLLDRVRFNPIESPTLVLLKNNITNILGNGKKYQAKMISHYNYLPWRLFHSRLEWRRIMIMNVSARKLMHRILNIIDDFHDRKAYFYAKTYDLKLLKQSIAEWNEQNPLLMDQLKRDNRTQEIQISLSAFINQNANNKPWLMQELEQLGNQSKQLSEKILSSLIYHDKLAKTQNEYFPLESEFELSVWFQYFWLLSKFANEYRMTVDTMSNHAVVPAIKFFPLLTSLTLALHFNVFHFNLF